MPRLLRKWYLPCLILTVVLLIGSILVMRKREDVIPVLVMACNRPYLKRCLETLIKYRPDSNYFPIIISQGCHHEETYKIIKSFADKDPTITHVHQPNQSVFPRHHVWNFLMGYYRIARHYKFALNYVFRTLQYKAVIILEDDLEIAPDFFEYFRGTYPLLYKDPTIWCVSAWNDNGKKELVDINEPELLHRTDFFPGLGWMLLSHTWEQLEPYWPQSYFDDWLRNPRVSLGRVCIRPELSRTFNFGKFGVSDSDFFDRHLRKTYLNQKYIHFTEYDLSYLMKRNEYLFFSFVLSQPEVTDLEIMADTLNSSLKYVQVPYANADEFKASAKILGLMDDLRYGVPRTGLLGVVQCFIKGRRVFLVPKKNTTVEYHHRHSVNGKSALANGGPK